MATKDYYKILGLTDEEKKLTGEDFIKVCKSNYRKLAKQFHPDKFANKSDAEKKEAEEKFKEITEAYDALTDPKKKQQYDQYGTSGGFDFEGFGGTGMDDIDEMLRRFRGGFNPFDAFGAMGGMNGMGGMGGFHQSARPHGPMKPSPLKIKLNVSIEDVYKSTSKKIRYNRLKPCQHCNGSGMEAGGKLEVCPECGGVGQILQTLRQDSWSVMQQTVPCPRCHGTGQIVSKPCKSCGGTGRSVASEELEVEIPAGVTDGSCIVYPNIGNYAERSNTIVGDLVIMFAVKQDPNYEIVNQYDLNTVVQIPILDCITGCERMIVLPNGDKLNVSIPKFSPQGKVLRLAGKGLPNGAGRGDLYVTVAQKFPTSLSSDEEAVINKLKESKNFKKV